MPLLHDARRSEQARGAGDEDWLGIAVAKRLEFAQPAGENGSDAVEWQLGVNAEKALRLACGEMLRGVEAQAALELGKLFSRKSKADGESVAAESSKEIGAGFEGGEEREAIDGAAGAVGDAIVGAVLFAVFWPVVGAVSRVAFGTDFDADYDGGFGGALDDARGENADNAAMPAVAVDDEEAVGDDFGVGPQACLDDSECGGFNVAALAIETLEFCG